MNTGDDRPLESFGNDELIDELFHRATFQGVCIYRFTRTNMEGKIISATGWTCLHTNLKDKDLPKVLQAALDAANETGEG